MKTTQIIPQVASIAAVLFLPACAPVETKHLSATNGDATLTARQLRNQREGIAYGIATGRLHIKIIKEADKTPEVTIDAVYPPDPRYQLVVNPKASGLSDDNITVTTSNGLLASIATVYKDQTTEIIKDIADAGIKAFQISHGVIPTQSTERTLGDPLPPEEADKPFVVDLYIDPFNEGQVATATAKLKSHGIVLDFRNIVKGAFSRYSDVPGDPGRVYYKPMLPYQVALYCPKQRVWFSRTVMLPNEAPIVSFELKRAMFVERKMGLTFTDGVLTSVNDTKPSELKALTGLVNDLIDKVVAIMPIQIKIDQSKARQAYLTQDTAEKQTTTTNLGEGGKLLDAEKAYRDKIKELEAAAVTERADEKKKASERSLTAKEEQVAELNKEKNDSHKRLTEQAQRIKQLEEAIKGFDKPVPPANP